MKKLHDLGTNILSCEFIEVANSFLVDKVNNSFLL